MSDIDERKALEDGLYTGKKAKEVRDKLGLNVEIKEEVNWLDEVDAIKGIGPETVKDINALYDNKAQLVTALEKGRVPLRNDHVKLLKAYLLKGGN